MDPTDQRVLGATVVSCDAPHEDELFARGQYPGKKGDPFPAGTALGDYADQLCRTAFEAYVGIPYDTSSLTFYYFKPDPSSWTAYEDRWIGCEVGSPPPANPLVGTVRGTKKIDP